MWFDFVVLVYLAIDFIGAEWNEVFNWIKSLILKKFLISAFFAFFRMINIILLITLHSWQKLEIIYYLTLKTWDNSVLIQF